MTSPALEGKTIVVTRPAEQADDLARLIRAAGGTPFMFPAIEVKPPENTARLKEILSRLEHFDLAIFISPTSVMSAWKFIESAQGWPKNLKAAAVGQGTARALRAHGLEGIIAPSDRFDSEALLALPALNKVDGENILIFRGQGGRELLAQTLTQRGARVEYAECYRRARPDADIAPLLELHSRHKLDGMILTSSESLLNLRAMLGMAWSELKSVPCFVTHERIAEAAHAQDLRKIEVVPASDAGMVQAMIKFFQS